MLRCLARLITFLMSLGKGEEGMEAEAFIPAAQEPGMPEIAQTPLWLVVLEKIFAVAFLLAAILLALWVLYRMILWVIHRFYENTARSVDETKGTVEIREKLSRQKREGISGKNLPLLGGNPQERIRRCFIQTIRRTDRFQDPGDERPGRAFSGYWGLRAREERSRAWEDFARGKTARQLGEAVGLAQKDAAATFSELVELYEKARYGKACTKEEAKQAGRAAAKLMRICRE